MAHRGILPGFLVCAWVAGAALAIAPPALAQRKAGPSWIGETGVASWYGHWHQGLRTASGTRFDKDAMTAAHPWLPFGTRVRVTLESTGRSVVVTITDRMPLRQRIIDLSTAAARKLGMVRQGVALVSLAPD